MRSTFAALAAFSMTIAVPAAVAQTTPASAPAVAARAADGTEGASEIVGTTAWILVAIAIGLIVWGVIQLTGDDGAQSP